MDTVQIVPITQDHIEGFHKALDIVARDRRYLAFLEAPPMESARAFVLGNIALGGPHMVALSAGQVVGWCDASRRESRPIYAHSAILGMGLLPEFRGKGIGRKLIRRTLAAAREFGFHRVELTVREDNLNAIELYKQVGFEIEGLQRDAFLVDGVYVNLIMMAVLF
jgi:ribosomal protein S18 acetylase RimI-like enzyme